MKGNAHVRDTHCDVTLDGGDDGRQGQGSGEGVSSVLPPLCRGVQCARYQNHAPKVELVPAELHQAPIVVLFYRSPEGWGVYRCKTKEQLKHLVASGEPGATEHHGYSWRLRLPEGGLQNDMVFSSPTWSYKNPV